MAFLPRVTLVRLWFFNLPVHSFLFCLFAVQQHVAVLCTQIQLGGLQIHCSNQSRHWRDESGGDSQWRIPTHFPGVWERKNAGAAGQVRAFPPQLPADLGISHTRPWGRRCSCHLFSQWMFQTSGNLTSCRWKSGFIETGFMSFLWSLYCLGQRCV